MTQPFVVTSVTGYYRDFVDLSADAELVASWADGRPLVAIDSGSGVVGITLFPNDYYNQVSGQYMELFGNALGGGGLHVTVNNVVPDLDPIAGPGDGPFTVGQVLPFSGSFNDVGTLDTHEVMWDFGDGTVIPFTSSDAAGILTPTHSYDESGAYQVTVTVRDDDGGVSSISKDIDILDALRATGFGEARDATALTDESLAPVVLQAIGLWAATGVDEQELSALGQAQFHIADLPHSVLGAASPAGSVWIDRDAAGHGWVLQSDPVGSFGTPGVDLLTTVVHELGHVLGKAHLDSFTHPEDVMAARLPLGVRRSPVASQPIGALAAGSLTIYPNQQVDDMLGRNLGTWSYQRARDVWTLDRPGTLTGREASEVSLDLFRGRSTSRWDDTPAVALWEDEADGERQSYEDWTSSLDAILADLGDEGDESSDRVSGIGS